MPDGIVSRNSIGIGKTGTLGCVCCRGSQSEIAKTKSIYNENSGLIQCQQLIIQRQNFVVILTSFYCSVRKEAIEAMIVVDASLVLSWILEIERP